MIYKDFNSPIPFIQIIVFDKSFQVRKDKAAKETVAVASGPPNGDIIFFKTADFLHKDRTA